MQDEPEEGLFLTQDEPKLGAVHDGTVVFAMVCLNVG